MNSHLKYISFDIFDTLLWRNVSQPIDVFSIVENIVSKQYKKGLIPKFADVRKFCEVEARNNTGGEVTLDSIYKVIASKYDSPYVDVYKKIEINTEIALVCPNPKVVNLYDHFKLQGYPIIIISDMYLPQQVIEIMLRKCGIQGYKKLYVSCEYNFTKSSGMLFDYVLKDLQISGEQLLHIGDSWKSDFFMARSRNIHTRHICKRSSKLNDNHNLTKNIIDNFCAINKQDSLEKEIGYNVFGPFLFGFLNWLKSKFDAGHYDKVYFLSRDGFYMKNAYEHLFGKSDNLEYFYASRRLLIAASLWTNPDVESVIHNMYLPRYFTIGWFLEMIGLDIRQCSDIFKDEEYNLETEFDRTTVLSDQDFLSFYSKIKNDLIKNSKKEFHALKKHLTNLGFSGNIAIVDIGWNGNMQKYLIKIADVMALETQITGLYVGIELNSPNIYHQKMEGYLYQPSRNEDTFYKLRLCANILELFFIAPHGSAKRYVINDDNAYIELEDFEYEGTKTFHLFKSFQNNALKCVDALSKMSCILDLDSSAYYNPLMRTFTNPNRQEACFFEHIKLWDKKWTNLVSRHSLLYYMLHPKQLTYDFYNSYWRPGLLKLIFKININYGNILSCLYRRFTKI